MPDQTIRVRPSCAVRRCDTMLDMATTLAVRLDDETERVLDELVAFYGKQAADLGLTADRSSTVRVILRAAHRDMRDKLAGNA